MLSPIESFHQKFKYHPFAGIEHWRDDHELSKLINKIESISDPQQFLDHYAELVVARHLVDKGCKLEVEVATTGSGTADFKVLKADNTFFAHVKRSNVPGQMKRDWPPSARLAPLKQISRPVDMSVLFLASVTDAEMRSFYPDIKDFAVNGRLGQRIKLRDDTGRLVIECEIHRLHDGDRIRLMRTGPAVFADDAIRIYEQLSRAYKRFKPGVLNAILLTGIWDDVIEDLREALEKFWMGQKHPDSALVIWFRSDLEQSTVDFLLIPRHNEAIPAYVSGVFGHKIDDTFLKCTEQST